MKKLLLLMAIAYASAFGQGQCSNQNLGTANITLSASGTTTVIAARTNQNIHVCYVDVSLTTPVGLKFVSIGSGGGDLSGVYANVVSGSWQRYGQPAGLGRAWGINLTGASVGGGTVYFYVTTGF